MYIIIWQTFMGARIVCLETDERALETAILAATLNILNYSNYRLLVFFGLRIFVLHVWYIYKRFLDAFYSRRNLNLDLPSFPFSFWTETRGFANEAILLQDLVILGLAQNYTFVHIILFVSATRKWSLKRA